MSQDLNGDPYSTWDAAYVLGALPTAERLQFEEHARGCSRCSTAVAELAGMPQLLNLAPTSGTSAATLDVEVPGTVLTSLLAAGRRRRRRRQVFLGGLVAAACLFALVIGVTLDRHDSPSQPAALLLTPVNAQLANIPIQASVRLAAEPWGTRLDVSCTYEDYPSGGSTPASTRASSAGATATPGAATEQRRYQLVVTDRAGHDVIAGGWASGASRTIWPTGSVSLNPADISRIAITSVQNVPLLQWKR